MQFFTSSDPSDNDLRDFLIAAIGTEVFMLIFLLDCKVYDLSTAAFFAFALGLLARNKFRAFYMLFPLAVINRETTLLLTAFFAIATFGHMPIARYVAGIGYQLVIFMVIRIMMMAIFQDNAGEDALFRPLYVLTGYAENPLQTAVLLYLVGAMLYGVLVPWHSKPSFLRTTFLFLFPVLLVLHVLLGKAFEIRVFAEVFPVAWILLWS